MDRASTESKLRERVKELTCLYSVTSTVLQHKGNIGDTLKKICQAVKAAYQFESYVIIELWIESHYILTVEELPETVSQSSSISVLGEELGFIKAHYPVEKKDFGHFLEEEQLLLDKIANEVGNFFEKLIVLEREKLFRSKIAYADRLGILHEISAGIAHELNTPLGNILGFAELIKEKAPIGQVRDDAERIVRSAIYSREIVKKLMLFSGEMLPSPEKINLTDTIRQCLSILGPSFKKKNVTSALEDANHPVFLFVDSVQLTQVIFNIVLNAIYASPENGIVGLRIADEGENISIIVTDSGPGVPDEIKSRIFEPFFTTKPFGEGTGLGLSVVSGIVRSHGGKIEIIDNAPSGAIFTILLPKNPGS